MTWKRKLNICVVIFTVISAIFLQLSKYFHGFHEEAGATDDMQSLTTSQFMTDSFAHKPWLACPKL